MWGSNPTYRCHQRKVSPSYLSFVCMVTQLRESRKNTKEKDKSFAPILCCFLLGFVLETCHHEV